MKQRCAAYAPAAVQEFESLDRKVDAHVAAALLNQLLALGKAGALLGSPGSGQHREAHCHGRVAVDERDLAGSRPKLITRLDAGLPGAGRASRR